ncbi:MAG: site-specific DNA-methyltransferase [Anaerolineae bacterium]|nr:site-specific DNA-methyltransferase [Anaerolineae bacterium]
MNHNYGEPIQKETANITEEQHARLKELFPQAFTEGRVDWDRLRAALGDLVDDSPERYTFTWAGKRDAIRLLQTPTCATLVPCREESVNFDTTPHLFIEGDNLEVLKLLYKPYFGRVKMIYIGPPYNTGKEFIYPDNYADPLATYLQLTGQQDAAGNLLTSNPETSGRYHSAWLSMMYPRLFLARQLLREDGVIFVSIDDHEVHNLRLLMNEVFGEENFVSTIIWEKKYAPQNDARWLSDNHDYIPRLKKLEIGN